jgi:hypothetical protein
MVYLMKKVNLQILLTFFLIAVIATFTIASVRAMENESSTSSKTHSVKNNSTRDLNLKTSDGKPKTGKLNSAREDLKIKTEAAREDFKLKLDRIKDERKKDIATRLIDRFNQINENIVDHFKRVLERLTNILNRVEKRKDKAKDHGVNVASVEAQIALARGAIAEASASASLQADKDYIISFTDETNLGQGAKQTKDLLFSDLKLVWNKVTTAKRAVQSVIRLLGSIHSVDEFEATAGGKVKN